MPLETAIPASITAAFKLIEFGLQYAEVSKETRELLHNLDLVDRKIQHTKNLRRVKSGWLDSHRKEDIDKDIDAAVNILKSIGATIESCRRDLAAKKSVTALHKLKWLFRDNQSFLKQERTLSNCLSVLLSDISTMLLLNTSTGDLLPPPYDPHHRFPSRVPTLVGPMARRWLAHKKSSASLASSMTGGGDGLGRTQDPSFAAEAAGRGPFGMSSESLTSVRTHEGVLSTPEDFLYADWKEVATSASIIPMHTHDGQVSLPVPEWTERVKPVSSEDISHGKLEKHKGIWRGSADYDLGFDEKPHLGPRSKSTPTSPHLDMVDQEEYGTPSPQPVMPRAFRTRSRNAGIS